VNEVLRMSALLEIGLFFVGILLGILWFGVIVLPLFYGFPRALYWTLRRWANWRISLLYLLSPIGWTLGFAAVVLFMVPLLPEFATYLANSSPFMNGQVFGFLLSVCRASFFKSARYDIARDFSNFLLPHLTEQGRRVFVRLWSKWQP
jgi:hypothetical protein